MFVCTFVGVYVCLGTRERSLCVMGTSQDANMNTATGEEINTFIYSFIFHIYIYYAVPALCIRDLTCLAC